MPWKNNLGVTYEIEIFPPGSTVTNHDFDYRISMAEIKSENVFSNFSGYQRILTIVRGSGINFNKEKMKLYEVKYFSGEEKVTSSPTKKNQLVIDLGVIFNPKKIKAQMKLFNSIDELKSFEKFDKEFVINTEDLDTITLDENRSVSITSDLIFIGISKV